MTGSKAGGLKAAATNKKRHGEDYYIRIGTKGGRAGNTGGFASDRELARVAGAKGGRISRRTDGIEWWNNNKETIHSLQSDGVTKTEIARKLGVKRGKIYHIISKYGGR